MLRNVYAIQLHTSYDYGIVFRKIKCLAVALSSLDLSQDALVMKKNRFCGSELFL